MKRQVLANRTRVLAIARRYGATNLRLIGSVARGTETPSSDIDFLATVEHGRSLFDLIGLEQELGDLLGRPVQVVPDDALKTWARSQVMAEAVPV